MKKTSQANRMARDYKHSSQNSPLIVITHIFQAPIEWVWKAWADPEIIEQWWGAAGYTSKYACMDFREGGKYFLDMEGPDGSIMWSTGTYKEIIPLKKIVCTDSFADKDGNIILGNDIGMKGTWPLTMYLTIEFEKIEDHQTRLTLSHAGIPKEVQGECVQGWNQSLDKFHEVVERFGNENLNQIQ